MLRHDVLYLGHESPPYIYEYNLTSSSFQRKWNLHIPHKGPDDDFTAAKENGIESLVFIASPNSKNGGFFYAGRQSDAKIFVYDVDLLEDKAASRLDDGVKNGTLTFRGTMIPPGPGYDLAGRWSVCMVFIEM